MFLSLFNETNLKSVSCSGSLFLSRVLSIALAVKKPPNATIAYRMKENFAYEYWTIYPPTTEANIHAKL